MNTCTAVALLPPPRHVIALSVPGHRPEAGHVLCELGENHDADHAAMLWDEGGRPGSAVWARWSEERAELASLPWCPARDAREEACGLFAGHPPGHSWEITDPIDEAITRGLGLV
ncbi:hypothetical protein EES43_08420 [Streptomyces sp. ADI96-02]|uniref:hypothetical protein n=1 Tax=Streptomyces sp. ADI96-02 TaxID=1522760 RepID=UPI000F54D9D4|nr:hypothetical protein [Streptomyces sp. ADI96-02]RPK65315.1 hypothetical protein EES43_08420 [Streptomyces sp. ADI96-02]